MFNYKISVYSREKSIKNVVTDSNSKSNSVKVYLSLFHYYMYTEENTLIYIEIYMS